MFPLYTPWVDIILRLPRDASWTPCIFLTKSCSWWDTSLFLSFWSYGLQPTKIRICLRRRCSLKKKGLWKIFLCSLCYLSRCPIVNQSGFPCFPDISRELSYILSSRHSSAITDHARDLMLALLKICSQNREGPPSAALLEHTSAPLWWFFDARFPSHPIITLFYCQACEASI